MTRAEPRSEALARLHAACFTVPRPWSAEEIDQVLDIAGTFVIGDGRGFAIGRAIAGEAELLTIAVDAALRGQGRGAALLERFEAESRRRAVGSAFLEVTADNAAALALYRRAGWRQVGRRPNYYRAPDGGRLDALIWRRNFAACKTGVQA